MPGDKKFDVQLKIVGDCCQSYGTLPINGIQYWKRSIFIGEELDFIYDDFNNQRYQIFGLNVSQQMKTKTIVMAMQKTIPKT